jgi:hypothetical protein
MQIILRDGSGKKVIFTEEFRDSLVKENRSVTLYGPKNVISTISLRGGSFLEKGDDRPAATNRELWVHKDLSGQTRSRACIRLNMAVVQGTDRKGEVGLTFWPMKNLKEARDYLLYCCSEQ